MRHILLCLNAVILMVLMLYDTVWGLGLFIYYGDGTVTAQWYWALY